MMACRGAEYWYPRERGGQLSHFTGRQRGESSFTTPWSSSCTESFGGARARLRGNLLAILRRRRRRQRVDKAAGDVRHFFDGMVGCLFVCLRRCVESAQLANELQRRRADLLVGRGGIEIEQGFYVPTHCCLAGLRLLFSTWGGGPSPPRASLRCVHGR